MPTCCRTCDHRNDAMTAWPSAPSQLHVCIVTLTFRTPINSRQSQSYIALNTLLNNIVDYEESTSNPSTFTVWSPCLSDSKTVVIITTVREVCRVSSASVFDDVRRCLARSPNVQHTYFDMAILSLAASSPEQRIACDIMQLHASGPHVAVAIGKMFGWDPKRSSISSQLQTRATAFSRPGDLIRDFWVWAELPDTNSQSASISTGSHETLPVSPPLINTNSDEKNMSLRFPEEDDEPPPYTDDESLIMIFQWNSHADGDRFKDHEMKSYGPNGEEVARDLWDRHVAYPVGRLQRIGARMDMFRLELRAVEPRMHFSNATGSQVPTARARSGSKRLSMIASGLGGKVSGLWK